MLIYRGPSLIDPDAPVIVVALPDYSKKVGTMLLTWILREDEKPSLAATWGDDGDKAICGECPLRATPKGRPCYVRPHREPDLVWEKYHDAEYPDVSLRHEEWQALVNPHRLPVRLGSYGDPAAVPIHVWYYLVSTASRYTGYTHLWRTCDPGLKQLCMASVDTLWEREEAQEAGWRTFYVRSVADGGHPTDDILCPASKEGGGKTTCDKCRLCMGTEINTRSIWIPAHGPGKSLFSS